MTCGGCSLISVGSIWRPVYKCVQTSGSRVKDQLNKTRIEIVTELREGISIPWELIRDPKTNVPLALYSPSFLRTHPQPAKRPSLPAISSTPVRILLVICRPGGSVDVPFRSVAMHILKVVDETTSEIFQLDVLRPPTFEQLANVLRSAQNRGEPYHLVHFDGHGVFLNLERIFTYQGNVANEESLDLPEVLVNFNPSKYSPRIIYPGTIRSGNRGYLIFENPQSAHNLRLVDGSELATLLVETGVPILVLNACRSAHSDPPPAPDDVNYADPHTKVRAFGSLAQEVMDAGVAGVVAMRYNLYVSTATQFISHFYSALAQGMTFGEATSVGRKHLHDQPLRQIAYGPIALQDWPVPIAYEAAPLVLFPESKKSLKLLISTQENQQYVRGTQPNTSLPRRPDAGFWGRDETLLALDRLFDIQSIVLLHAYAGSGKTSTAVEFGRWYALTGGIVGTVIFTSFEHYNPLSGVLNQFGQMFSEALGKAGIDWAVLDKEERRQVVLQITKQVPVLWIWDNVELIAGFPSGKTSAWDTAEQLELAEFLREAGGTKAKFLLTSRRDEREWLSDLPARIILPPMPMQERMQFARALAEKYSQKLSDVRDWRPLLEFTHGNPLTILVLVRQALRDGLHTSEEIESFITLLRAGEAEFDDEASEGRSKSLGASLRYGFEHSFSDEERKQLALLHLFQGFVSVDVLRLMGDSNVGKLPEVKGLTRDAGVSLLDRAAEIGLLTALSNGFYSIHPALPWFFKRLFNLYYLTASTERENKQTEVESAFVEAMGFVGGQLTERYETGSRNVINTMMVEEANLIHALRIARTHEWWKMAMYIMQCLHSLYGDTGRRAENKRLIDDLTPELVDPTTNGPVSGREEHWSQFIHFRVRLARQSHQLVEAEKLLLLQVKWNRHKVTEAFITSPLILNDKQHELVRSLAISLEWLGHVLREQGRADCLSIYEEAITLYQQIDEILPEALTALSLSRAYARIPDIRNLEEAENWCLRSIELIKETDALTYCKCLRQMGVIAHYRFLDALATNQPAKELNNLFNLAVYSLTQSIELIPKTMFEELMPTYNELGALFGRVNMVEESLDNYRKAIFYAENLGDRYRAAVFRYNVAHMLANTGRKDDALEYARSALRSIEIYGDEALEMITSAKALITELNK